MAQSWITYITPREQLVIEEVVTELLLYLRDLEVPMRFRGYLGVMQVHASRLWENKETPIEFQVSFHSTLVVEWEDVSKQTRCQEIKGCQLDTLLALVVHQLIQSLLPFTQAKISLDPVERTVKDREVVSASIRIHFS